MKLRVIYFMTILSLFAFVAFTGCGDDDDDDNDNDNNDSDDDDNGGECYELGEPFTPPEGVTDPWRLVATEICCDGNSLTVAEEMTEDSCVPLEPLQFVCGTAGYNCNEEQNFCTHPLGCEPPESFPQKCCGEGDYCWTEQADELPTSGVIGCCQGLEEIDFDLWNAADQECVGMGTEYGIICVKDCGDGDCTMGENPCNCPEDCPADQW